MPDTTLTLTDDQRKVLTFAVQQPSWATSLDAILDGTETLKVLRALTPGDDGKATVALTPFQLEACKSAVQSMISKGMFGPGEDLATLCQMIGLHSSRPR